MTAIKEGGAIVKVQQYRAGRNFIRVGDAVKVKATPGRRNGFKAVVRAIRVDEGTQEVAEVEVYGGPPGHAMARTFRRDRIERVAQSRNGNRKDHSL